MKSLLSVGFVLVVMAITNACAPVQVPSNLAQTDNPIIKEVLTKQMVFYDRYITLNADNFSSFYAKDAYIYANGGRYSAESFEARKKIVWGNFKRQGIWWNFDIQSIQQSDDGGVVVTSLHKLRGKKSRDYLRYFEWKKIGDNWKIISQTTYPPEFITEEDLLLPCK